MWDSNGEALIGASVSVKGAKMGISTDLNGKYILPAVNENAVLVISYLGFETQEIPVNGIL